MNDLGRPDGEALALIERALAEDVGAGDWTTEWTVEEDTLATGVIVAKERAVVAGAWVAVAVFERVDLRLEAETLVTDGSVAEVGETILRIEGPARGILTAERTALNFLGRLSGIATTARAFADAVSGTGATILDTRKTTPGWRDLEKWAVRVGGAANHRRGLDDMVLVKDNHIVAAGGVAAAVGRVARGNVDGLPVEVEVTSLGQLGALERARVDRIMLDNMSEETMAQAVERIRGWERVPEIEASGNMTLERVRSVAETGVDFISVGALTHSPRSVDLSLRLDWGSGR